MSKHEPESGNGLSRPVSTRSRLAALLSAPVAALGAAGPIRTLVDAADKPGGPSTDDLGLPASNSIIDMLDNRSANPYPSIVRLANLKGFVSQVNLILKGFRHDRPSDVGVLLAHAGRATVIMRGASDGTPVRGANLLFNDAGQPLPDNTQPLEGGRQYQPGGSSTPIFGDGAPGASSTSPSLTGTFEGLTPNGEWALYIRDEAPLLVGTLFGWQLEIVTDNPGGGIIVIDNYRTRAGRKLVVDRSRGLLALDQSEPRNRIVRLAQEPRGRLNLREDGSFTYEPPSKRRREDSFTYTIVSEFGTSIQGQGEVRIKIAAGRRRRRR